MYARSLLFGCFQRGIASLPRGDAAPVWLSRHCHCPQAREPRGQPPCCTHGMSHAWHVARVACCTRGMSHAWHVARVACCMFARESLEASRSAALVGARATLPPHAAASTAVPNRDDALRSGQLVRPITSIRTSWVSMLCTHNCEYSRPSLRQVIKQWIPGSGAEDFVSAANVSATKPIDATAAVAAPAPAAVDADTDAGGC